MLRYLDSADHYNDSFGGNCKWQNFNASSTASGRNGRGIAISGFFVSKTIDYQNTWYVGWAFYLNEGVAFANGGLYQLMSNGTPLATLKTQPDGTLALYAGNTLNLIGVSGSINALHLHTWYYVELSMVLSGGSGAISLTAACRINGVNFIASNTAATGVNGSSLVIQDSKANQHTFFNSNVSGNTLIDDIYIADGQTGNLTTYAGDIVIGCLYPNGDVTTDFNATGSPSFSQINATFANSASTTNIFSNNVGDVDNFNWQDIPAFTGDIVGVHYGILAKKDIEGSRIASAAVGTGATPRGNDFSPSDNFVYFFLAMDQDPDTSSAWTQSGFNSKEFGVKIIA